MQKLGFLGGRSFSLTSIPGLPLPSRFRDRAVRHALPILGPRGTPLGSRFPSSGPGVGFLGLERPSRQHRGMRLASGIGSERTQASSLRHGTEGPSRPNSELPPRPPLGPRFPKEPGTESWGFRSRIQDPVPKRGASSLRPLELRSPHGRSGPGASSTGAEGQAASPALPAALNYLPWAGGSSSAGAARASQLRSRRWRSRPLPLAPWPLI